MDVKRFLYMPFPRIVKRGKTYQLPRVTEVRTEEIRKNGIFTMLEQNPHIGQSKGDTIFAPERITSAPSSLTWRNLSKQIMTELEPNCGGVCSHGDHYSDATSEQDLAHCCELDL